MALDVMKISLIYPKIPDTTNCPLKKCIAFEKYDGTNLHWVFNQENGWTHFGTRRNRFELTPEGIVSFHQEHPGLEDCVSLFETTVKPLSNYLLSGKYGESKEIIVFTEYLGENSFAGQHIVEPHKLMVIDALTSFGWLRPGQFGGDFGGGMYLPEENFPKIVWSGKYSGQFVEDVRNGKFPVKEGVIIKGEVKGQTYMAKIKTNAYLDRLKTSFKDKWTDYWE